MFIIRADGNSVIGMGHVMRCLSIADAIKKQGVDSVFVTACKECLSVMEQRGYQVRLLSTDYRDMPSELPQIERILAEENNQVKRHVILVDSYQVTEYYYRELAKLAMVACLEDMGKPYPVHLLINYNIYGPNLASVYESDIANKPQKTLLGATYIPLRNEFLEDISYELREKVTDVMITTGGSDPCFAAKAFTEAFLADERLQKEDIRYHIVSGPFNSHAGELKELYAKNSQVVIHENVKNMKEIMRQCDVVLTAAGSTVYEVSALGIPMMVFYFADNQRQGAEEIERITAVVNCEDFSKNPEYTIYKAVEILNFCVKKKQYREILNRDEKQLVDGKGACRIAKALIELAQD